MLRTSITVTAAVATALAVLTACGPVQMGQAAIVGSQGVTTATLAGEVSNLESTYHASKAPIQLQFPLAQAPQEVLGWLVRFRIREQMAARNGITVTPAQSQQARAALAAQARQNRVTLAALAVANGLPPDLLPELGRYQAIEVAIVAKLDGGTLPSSQAGLSALSKKFDAVQCHAAKSLDIKVNPQYGQMDYSQLSIVPSALTLSAPEGGVPTPSPGQRLTPPC